MIEFYLFTLYNDSIHLNLYAVTDVVFVVVVVVIVVVVIVEFVVVVVTFDIDEGVEGKINEWDKMFKSHCRWMLNSAMNIIVELYLHKHHLSK